MLALFSFGTTVLMYDFSGTSNVETATVTTAQSSTSSLAKKIQNLAPTATTSTSTEPLASSAEKLAMENNNTATQTKPTTNKPIPTTTIAPIPNKVTAVSSTHTTTPPKTVTTKPTHDTEAPTKNTPISWGVFTGSNLSDLNEFERKVDENPDYLAYFVHWANHDGMLNPWTKSVVYDRDRTLVLFWEASDYIIGGTNQPAYSYKAILRGDHDKYISDFAKNLKDYKGPIILIPFSELNGDWSPWSGTKNGNTPAEAVKAFQYVHGFFSEVPNVSFGWAVNAFSVPNTPENQIPYYYPGDAYVDIVGVDGFNFGDPWLTFDQKFSAALSTLAQYNKPTFIFSFGSAPGSEKAAWLNDALNVQLPRYPNVKAWIYFNQNKERNWLLWSDKETFSVFEDYISK
jgi:beta-mannanase